MRSDNLMTMMNFSTDEASSTEDVAISREILKRIFEVFEPYELDVLTGSITMEEAAEERDITVAWLKKCINKKKKILLKEVKR